MNQTVPHELWNFYQKDGYFFIDHGDIYYGSFIDFGESVFVVEPRNRKKVNELISQKPSIEDIRQLAWEIKDFNKIKAYTNGKQDIGNTDPYPGISRNGNQQWKKMFVLGAGASAFSVFSEDIKRFRSSKYAPPIANEMFGNKFKTFIKKYPGVQLSLSSLKAAGNDIESFFEDEWQDMSNSKHPETIARHINILYYLRELFLKISTETTQNFYDCSLYSVFVNKIKRYISKNINDRVAFVSFNYDTILDHYIEGFFNHSFKLMDDYVPFESKRFLLFKPHGSCNWGWKFREDFIQSMPPNIHQSLYHSQDSFYDVHFRHLGPINEMVYQKSWGHELSLSGHYRGKFSINKNKIDIINGNTDYYFPSLLIPYRDKDEMVMPYYHYDLMQSFIQEMEDLYLIGWKGNEALFNQLIKDHAQQLKRIVIVNPAPKDIEANLKKYIDLKKYELKYFNDFESFTYSEIN